MPKLPKVFTSHLRDKVEVRHEGALEDDGDVGGVKELDGVGGGLARLAAQGQVDDEEKALVQGFNDVLVFGSAASGSLLAGILQNQVGWESLNVVVAPPLLLLAGWLLWLKSNRGIPIRQPIIEKRD